MSVEITWPSALPLPTIDSYGLQPRPSRIRSDMDQGAARQRRRFTMAMTDVPVGFVLTRNQLMIFEGWLDARHQYGAVWFGIDLVNGVGLSTQEARFKDDPDIRPLGGNTWRVTGTLEVRNRPVLSDADLTVIEGEDLDLLFATVADLYDYITGDLGL